MIFLRCFVIFVIFLVESVHVYGFHHCQHHIVSIPTMFSNSHLVGRKVVPHLSTNPKYPLTNSIRVRSKSTTQQNNQADVTSTTVVPFTTTSTSLLTALSIIALVLQNSGLALTMRLSRITNPGSTSMYAPSTAVLVSELMKFLISYVTYHMSDTNTRKLSIREMAVDVPMLVEVSIPSALYVLQNNLQYIAMSSLPAAIYQVLVQMKIITAAILSKIYLKRLISAKQWVSISALTFGVIIVQLSLQIKSIAFSNLNIPLGVVAVILSCFTSGYAGVKLESTLKDSRESLWVRNLQISIVSITIAGLACLKDFRSLWEHGFFHGYSPLVFLVILIQAVGGILVSLVVKNTSTIVKGFATAASIIVTSFISAFFLNDVKINATFLVGALIVCLSTITYSSR